MRLYRIARRPYSDLSGAGGLHHPGRWHDRGHRILYTASSIALAAVEFAVHSSTRPADTMLLEIEFDGLLKHVEDVIGGPLPDNWASDHAHTRPIGTQWLTEGMAVGLSVPSIVIPLERNILLNPDHPDFIAVRALSCKPFFFDPRLFTRSGNDRN